MPKDNSKTMDEPTLDTKSDLVIDMRGTVLSTNTVYEDRTNNPEIAVRVPLKETHSELGNGTILVSYGDVEEAAAEAPEAA